MAMWQAFFSQTYGASIRRSTESIASDTGCPCSEFRLEGQGEGEGGRGNGTGVGWYTAGKTIFYGNCFFIFFRFYFIFYLFLCCLSLSFFILFGCLLLSKWRLTLANATSVRDGTAVVIVVVLFVVVVVIIVFLWLLSVPPYLPFNFASWRKLLLLACRKFFYSNCHLSKMFFCAPTVDGGAGGGGGGGGGGRGKGLCNCGVFIWPEIEGGQAVAMSGWLCVGVCVFRFMFVFVFVVRALDSVSVSVSVCDTATAGCPHLWHLRSVVDLDYLACQRQKKSMWGYRTLDWLLLRL